MRRITMQPTRKNQARNWPLRNSYIRQINNVSSLMQELNNDGLTATRLVEAPGKDNSCEFINPLSSGIRITKEDGATKDEASQFAYSLWTIVESIPANLAHASENPFVNLKLVRMSSRAGHFRFASKSTNNVVVTVKDSAAKRKKYGRNNHHKGFFFLSIIVALCALFWVFIGTMEVSGRSVL